MSLSVRFPGWVNQFQNLAIVNKAVLDVAGVDAPIILLAKNRTEQKERIFRQSLVLIGTFLLAPFHALAVHKVIGRSLPDARLLQLSSSDLLGLNSLKRGVNTLSSQLLRQSQPRLLQRSINNQLRHSLIKAKTSFLLYDLVLMGVLFSNLGWFKNFFGQLLSGNKQFSGELGLIPQQKLDTLYKKQQQQQKYTDLKKIMITCVLGLCAPLLLVSLLKRALITPGMTNPIFKLLRKNASRFDYQYKWGFPFMANLSLACVTLTSDFSEIIASRSPRERNENLMIRPLGFISFMFGDQLWTRAFTKTFSGPVKMATASSLQRGTAGKNAALLYLFGFLMNVLTLSGIITGANYLTRRSVLNEAAKLDASRSTHTPIQKGPADIYRPSSYAKAGPATIHWNRQNLPSGYPRQNNGSPSSYFSQ